MKSLVRILCEGAYVRALHTGALVLGPKTEEESARWKRREVQMQGGACPSSGGSLPLCMCWALRSPLPPGKLCTLP